VDIGFSFSASASEEIFRVISIEAELPPIGGEEGCHACPMVGFAHPVHPDQGEEILLERPDGLHSHAMLDQGEGLDPNVIRADAVLGAAQEHRLLDRGAAGSGQRAANADGARGRRGRSVDASIGRRARAEYCGDEGALGSEGTGCMVERSKGQLGSREKNSDGEKARRKGASWR
jgi:hypothetical protein